MAIQVLSLLVLPLPDEDRDRNVALIEEVCANKKLLAISLV